MSDRYSFDNVESLLVQIALQVREVSQKKNELNQMNELCRADIAEMRSSIDTLHSNIKKLDEEIKAKQSTLMHNQARAKSMKTTNSQLLQYEQMLKEELESRKASYKHDVEMHEEQISSYRKIFQSQKEYYYQNPLAQKLLKLQAENEEIASRIKACDDQMAVKQKELDLVTGPEVNSVISSSTEKPPDSVSGQKPIAEPETQVEPPTEEDSDSSINTSSCHLNQTKEQQPAGSDMEEVMVQEEKEEGPVVEEEMEPSKEDNEGLAAFPQSSPQETNPESSPATVKAVPSTPMFPFNFSPGSSPHGGNSDTKSPAFPFFLNSDPSTPGFSGFGFDVGSSQEEDSSFAFSGPLFNEKKTTETKSSSCPEFLFGQPEQSEDFQFAFTAKSPQTADKDNNKDEFPFSFNF